MHGGRVHEGIEIREGQSGVKVTRKTRIERNNIDIQILVEFFTKCFLFDPFVVTPSLKNFVTGMIAPENVNVQNVNVKTLMWK